MTRARTSQNWLAALLAGMLLTGAQAQEVSTSPAQELMDAHAKFGLDLAHGEPFHLKLRLATFDESGKPTGSGSFEEFSDGKGRTKLMESHQLTGKSPWLVAPVDGDLTREPYFMRKGIEVFLRPLPSREELSSQSLEEKKTMLGSIPVSCITRSAKAIPAGLCAASGRPHHRGDLGGADILSLRRPERAAVEGVFSSHRSAL